MRLARFWVGDELRVGAERDGELVDLSAAADGCTDLVWLLAERADALAAGAADPASPRYGQSTVRLAPPLRPPKFFAVGLNYADHAQEAGIEAPAVPTIFNKQPTSVLGGGGEIERPQASTALDYEGELGFVIGRHCRHVPAERAHEVIVGYLIVNDVSVRDWQLATPTVTMGKSWDTHGPLGPWLTTADEIEDPQALRLRTWVNGDLRQDCNTRHLIFDCAALVAHLSTVCTLEPGDVVATGTPSGVGALMTPPQYLVPGDVVRIAIDGLGTLENTVVDERDPGPRIGP